METSGGDGQVRSACWSLGAGGCGVRRSDGNSGWQGRAPPWAPQKNVIGEKVQAAKDIREGVRKELDFDPLVYGTDITVKNMNGDVALNGTVPSYR
jgi:hypothetical protein